MTARERRHPDHPGGGGRASQGQGRRARPGAGPRHRAHAGRV